jgi:hypothetical protein
MMDSIEMINDLEQIIGGLESENNRLLAENERLQSKLNQLHEAYTVDIGKQNDVIDQIRAELAAIKPQWENAPEWAKWLASDEDGDWYWYEDRPSWGMSDWFMEGIGDGYRQQEAGKAYEMCGHLEHRPEASND